MGASTILARVAASATIVFALLTAASVVASTLSLADRNFKRRASSTAFDHVNLRDGLDRSRKSNKQWVVIWPHDQDHSSSWPTQKTPNTRQMWETHRAVGGLFDYTGDERYWTGMREWGYAFHRLTDGGNAFVGCSGDVHGFDATPTSDRNALVQMRNWWVGNKTYCSKPSGLKGDYTKDENHLIAKVGHYYYHHYSLAFDKSKIDLISSEVGENINSVQAHTAFTRGAARQYGKPWGIDMSDWWREKLSDHGGSWLRAASQVTGCYDVQTREDWVAWLTDTGSVKYLTASEKTASDATTLESSGVSEFLLGNNSGTRFVVRKSGTLKAGGTGSLSTISSISGVTRLLYVEYDRIAVQTSVSGASFLRVHKRSGNTASYAGTYNKVRLGSRNIVALRSDGVLRADVLSTIPSGNRSFSKTISSNVSDFEMYGNVVIYIGHNGSVYFDNDITDSTNPWAMSMPTRSAAVKRVALGSNRLALLFADGNLYARTLTNSPSVSNSDLVANNVVDLKINQTGNNDIIISRQIEGGLDSEILAKTGALNATWTDVFHNPVFDFGIHKNTFFVQTKADEQILFKRRGYNEYEYSGDTLNTYKSWTCCSQRYGGHSTNLMKRVYYTSYLEGSNVLYAEGNYVFGFLGATSGESDGPLPLSDIGAMSKRFYDFTKNRLPAPERGIPWAPIGIMIDYYHGLGYESWGHDNEYWKFNIVFMNSSDMMSVALFKTIWPGSFAYFDQIDVEYGMMVNNEYGEIFDVLVDRELNTDLLYRYPVLLLTGEIRVSNNGAAFESFLKQYVAEGGNLIINTQMRGGEIETGFTGVSIGASSSHKISGLRWKPDNSTHTADATIAISPATLSNGAQVLMETTDSTPKPLATIKQHSEGRVIVILSQDLQLREIWDLLLKKLSQDTAVSPITLSNYDIMYSMSYKGDDTWFFTFTENKYVNKAPYSKGYYTPTNLANPKSITVTYQEPSRDILTLEEYALYGGEDPAPPSHSNNQFTFTIGPGEVKVFKLVSRPASS